MRLNPSALCEPSIDRKKSNVRKFFLAVALCTAVYMQPAAARAQTVSVLYNFGASPTDAAFPFWEGIIAQGRDGNLYSTTMDGGTNGWGTAFKITPAGSLTLPFSFPADGTPEGGLTLGTDGNFYGTTQFGGVNGAGQIFKMTPAGVLTVLYTFTGGSDGSSPFASPVLGIDGNFYGTATSGGTGFGIVYKITPGGTFTVLHPFMSTDGANPHAPLVLGNNGNLYGTTWVGGTSNLGVVFKITSGGGLTVLHNFDGVHGENPNGPLVQGSDGNFYGTTSNGGASNAGVIFKVTPGGKFTMLHSLNGANEGSQPLGGLVQATDGNFYVTASAGGNTTACSGGCGTIFKVTSRGTFSPLYTFDGVAAATPAVTLIQHTNGFLYGDAENGGSACSAPGCGVFYRLDVGLGPFVALVSTSGKDGKIIEILGQGFTGTTAVSFNGTIAAFKVFSNTYLTATVPTGATTGFVTVNTPSGTLTSSSKFRVLPVVSSFAPTGGVPGSQVVITGSGLTGTNKVTFGGVAATTFGANSDTQVTATVPAGAVTGKIMVTTPTSTASSSTSFSVTPSNCASGTTTEVFDSAMQGCAGNFAYNSRSAVCASGTLVCTAAEWNAHRGTATAGHMYWTGDNPLKYVGGSTNSCTVSASAGSDICTGSAMLVCSGSEDAEHNTCNIWNCGLDTSMPQSLGGCASGPTGTASAGALCCRP